MDPFVLHQFDTIFERSDRIRMIDFRRRFIVAMERFVVVMLVTAVMHGALGSKDEIKSDSG